MKDERRRSPKKGVWGHGLVWKINLHTPAVCSAFTGKRAHANGGSLQLSHPSATEKKPIWQSRDKRGRKLDMTSP